MKRHEHVIEKLGRYTQYLTDEQMQRLSKLQDQHKLDGSKLDELSTKIKQLQAERKKIAQRFNTSKQQTYDRYLSLAVQRRETQNTEQEILLNYSKIK